MTDYLMKRAKKNRNLSIEAKLSMTMQQAFTRSSRKTGSGKPSLSPYALPVNPSIAQNDYSSYLEVLNHKIPKQQFNRRCLLPGTKPRLTLSSQKCSRNSSADQRPFNTTFNKKNDYLLFDEPRPGTHAWGYGRVNSQIGKGLKGKNESRTLTRQHLVVGKCESRDGTEKSMGNKRKTNKSFLLDDDTHKRFSQKNVSRFPTEAFNKTCYLSTTTKSSKEIHVPSLSGTTKLKQIPKPLSNLSKDLPNNKTPYKNTKPPLKPEVTHIDRLMSFCASVNQLEADPNEELEELENAAKVKPYALIMDELKPMFFFNLKARKEDPDNEKGSKESSEFNTPSFIETFRDEGGDSQKPRPNKAEAEHNPKMHNYRPHKYCPMIKLTNEAKGSIFINKTTIINNIINSNKKGQKRSGAPKRDGITQNERLSKSFISTDAPSYCI